MSRNNPYPSKSDERAEAAFHQQASEIAAEVAYIHVWVDRLEVAINGLGRALQLHGYKDGAAELRDALSCFFGDRLAGGVYYKMRTGLSEDVIAAGYELSHHCLMLAVYGEIGYRTKRDGGMTIDDLKRRQAASLPLSPGELVLLEADQAIRPVVDQ